MQPSRHWGAVVLGALSQPRRWLSDRLQSQRWKPLCHFQDPLFIWVLMFPFKLCSLSPLQPHSLIHPDTHSPKKCYIFESSSGTISWCQPCVVWSDSHALWGGVNGWMDAQSTIALINTNSYARCIQVLLFFFFFLLQVMSVFLSEACCLLFWQPGNSPFPFPPKHFTLL